MRVFRVRETSAAYWKVVQSIDFRKTLIARGRRTRFANASACILPALCSNLKQFFLYVALASLQNTFGKCCL